MPVPGPAGLLHGLPLAARVDPVDPLADFRAGEASVAGGFEALLEREGVIPERTWERGGPPVAVAGDVLYLQHEGTVYRVPRDRVTGIGRTRASDYRLMQYGVGLYLVALPLAVIGGWGLLGLAAVAGIVAGGGLVTKGFLSKALLIEVDDERVPPFVVDHRKWKSIHASIQHWA